MKAVFEFESYRAILEDYLEMQPKGAKLRLAGILGCQPGYVSQILNGDSELSPEQAERFTSHLGLDFSSTQYFLMLVSFERAGTTTLKSHYRVEIERRRSEAQVLKNRLRPEKILSVEDQAIFYSSWHYGAFHVCVSIPGCETEEGISQYFSVPLKRVNEVIQFLLKVGLVKKSDSGTLSIGSTQIFIGSDSPLISKHHTNWRVRAIESLDHYKDKHLHYSSVISVSKSDVDKVRELMVSLIQQIRSIVRESKDEACYSYAMDLFEVGK